MKILGILASHDNSGITAQMLANVLRPANGKCDSETIYLDDYQIKPDLPGKSNPTLDLLEKKFQKVMFGSLLYRLIGRISAEP